MPQKFGSAHTIDKLDKLEAYLKAFATALKSQQLRLVYFDAFAGTPEIDVGGSAMPLLATDEFQPFLEGSSRRALKFGTQFANYIFVDSKRANTRELENLKTEFPKVGRPNRNTHLRCQQ